MIRAILCYMYSLSGIDQRRIIEGELSPVFTRSHSEAGDEMMTIAEYYVEQGREQGIDKGRREERDAIAMELLREGTSDFAFISRVSHLSLAQLKALASDMAK